MLLTMYNQPIVRGIYSINFSNGKRYIGMSNDIKARIKEHKCDAKNNDLLPVHRAMRLYNYDIEVLEECIESREVMCAREKYWIKYYQTFLDKNKGYNLTPGGDGAPAGTYNSSAKLSEKDLIEIYDLLINHRELFIYQIAAKFNLSPEAVSDINCGKRYFNEFLLYPLRSQPKPQVQKGINHHNAVFDNKEAINAVYNDLKQSILSIKEIAKKYNVCENTISKINQGHQYYDENNDYPLRKQKVRPKITTEKLNQIYNLLINTNLTYKQIGQKVGVVETTIYRINKGASSKQPNFTYPIRANKEINQAVSTIFASEE